MTPESHQLKHDNQEIWCIVFCIADIGDFCNAQQL